MRTLIQFLGAVLLAGFVLGGCSRDPNVRKQKYFDSGTRYFHAGKYREAAIELENAIQLDPNFAAAHYQLAQCYIREAFWNGAY
jgi:Tfp pilus assembly protein PilF